MKSNSLKMIICFLLLTLYTSAQEVMVDNIWYMLEPSLQSASIIRIDSAHHNSHLRIPSSVQYQGNVYEVTKVACCAFEGNDFLEKIELPNTINTIDSFAFMGCSRLESVHLGGNVSILGTAAFGWCPKLKRIVLSPNLSYLPNLMCFGCSNLKKVVLPRKVKYIGNQAFEGCSNLTNIKFPIGLKSIGFAAFKNCKNIRTIVLPYSVDTLKSASFSYCERLVYLQLGAPKRIQNSAFKGCKAIRKIKITASDPPSMLILHDEIPFEHCVLSAVVIIPRDSKDIYQRTEGWYLFLNYREACLLTR